MENEFIQYPKDFMIWLQRLGYKERTYIREARKLEMFFAWLKNMKIHSLNETTQNHLHDYKKHLENKLNNKGATLSERTVQGHLGALKLFSRYLQAYGHEPLVKTSLSVIMPPDDEKEVLTKTEIKKLYECTDNTPFGYRDRAMLAVFYGCGLRNNEGIHVKLEDIDFKRGLLFVSKGKFNRQRYVPMHKKVMGDLLDYILNARKIICNIKSENLFVGYNKTGTLKGDALNNRLIRLKETAGIEKTVTLHILRHSIATHLLQSGMELHRIAQFLGHLSMETTQKYTHIAHGEGI